VLIQLADAIDDLRRSSESQAIQKIPGYASLINDGPEATAVKNKAESDLKTAQATIPQLISATAEELRQCRAK
jgi:hypothetical protein